MGSTRNPVSSQPLARADARESVGLAVSLRTPQRSPAAPALPSAPLEVAFASDETLAPSDGQLRIEVDVRDPDGRPVEGLAVWTSLAVGFERLEGPERTVEPGLLSILNPTAVLSPRPFPNNPSTALMGNVEIPVLDHFIRPGQIWNATTRRDGTARLSVGAEHAGRPLVLSAGGPFLTPTRTTIRPLRDAPNRVRLVRRPFGELALETAPHVN